VVGRGWGNGPQHTQSHHALFAHIPGLKTVVPATPRDAKGLLLAAIEDDDPVMYIEHRWLHEDEADVPSEYFTTPLGQAAVLRSGTDVTIVAIGPMVSEALKAAQALDQIGLSAEIIDVRTLRPLDSETILASVVRTGRLIVVDSDWPLGGIAAEIVARIAERALDALRARPRRITWPDSSVPSSQAIESQFYPGAREIQEAAVAACQNVRGQGLVRSTVKEFHGPF
jgi:acetoin:2,6-dichlorophenolindophenol oxidoreductase subunit beta